jgi:hypothetical protein
MNFALILPYLMASSSLYPCSYVGSRLGVTATVVRLDGANANLTLRAGPLRIAQGGATLSSDGALSLDEKIMHTLHARGVSVVDVAPSDDVIDVRASVRFLGEIPIRLLRVQTSRT